MRLTNRGSGDGSLARWRSRIGSLCLAAGGLAVGAAAWGATYRCQTAPEAKRVALVELYTSEGCESCPPAERLFSSLDTAGDVLPLVWHVHYFDRLGWSDRFALPESAHRQRLLVAGNSGAVVSTPQVYIGGTVFSDWRDTRAFRSKARRSRVGEADGAINIDVTQVVGDEVRFAIATRGVSAGTMAQVALVQGGLVSHITAGENKGRTLTHEHVVRDATGPIPLDTTQGRIESSLRLPKLQPNPSFRVVAWLQGPGGAVQSVNWAECAP